ncbi:hypothetical protein CI109_104687 [Kwoniella shandongensis]|uniref:Uncharacterized protein n=1 Tax=Kwoniella shandongensis TaxID=1734106 RepID=A0A5M6BXE6_9TREE|nr:uncharacterized protein CI109_004850 [Kwoniella shandongensis]KAA5526850.1 hypothetical protein CI109_004850 [Kwoniella shandongensis]
MLSTFRTIVSKRSLAHRTMSMPISQMGKRTLTDTAADPKLAPPSEELTPEAKEAEPDAADAAKEMEKKGQDVLPTIT